MRTITRLSAATIAAAAVLAGASGSASAFGGPPHRFPFGGEAGQPVFVQTDNLAGNQVVAYDRAGNGTLTQAGVYSTGGLGGALEGSVVDHLASQGSLAYDAADGLLYAVNAGSNTISVFAVFGDHLALRQVLSSGGSFPVSITVRGDVVYVLNAEDGGSVQGYVAAFGHLLPIPGSARALGLNPTASPQFTNTPGQLAFSPDGSKLIVTTKANGSDIDVFRVFGFGQLSQTPVVNSEPGTVPFAVTFDQEGNLVVAEAAGALASFRLNRDGTVTLLDAVETNQAATCWVAAAGSRFYASNAGSASLSGFQSGFDGALTLLGDTPTDAGTVDAAVSGDARFIYVQTGAAGIVDEFAIGAQGALSEIGTVTVPGAIGGEGIVAG
ncbi:MAG: beta-propeller fold lactonase family protein [Solirubrobacteraceae bacterium]|jgi:6-phosphogluconolactonase (cycloisomerase 2 family)